MKKINLLLIVSLITFNLSAQQNINKKPFAIELGKARLTSIEKPIMVSLNISEEDYAYLNSKSDSILNTLSPSKKKNLLREITDYQDKAMTIATNRYPNPDDIYPRRETRILLEEKNIKLWGAKYDWYNQLNLTAEKKFVVAYLLQSKIQNLSQK